MNHETAVFFGPFLIGLALSLWADRVKDASIDQRIALGVAALIFFSIAVGVELAYFFDPHPGHWISTFRVVQS